MPCYHPITAFQAEPGTPLLFERPEWGATQRGGGYHQLEIACGQCSGCRLKRSREWAMRCMHEKQMHKHASFITLTYNQENLPENNSLTYRHFQLFMKKLRKAAFSTSKGRNEQLLTGSNTATMNYSSSGPTLEQPYSTQQLERHAKTAPRIRFYMCGEYGETYGRPHYHAILFGIDFADKTYFSRSPGGGKIYRSATLESLWKHGFSSTADVTFNSAAYVARYVMKKRTGDGETLDYKILDLETGEIISKRKEFNNMSRRPGIGSTWLEKFKDDVYTTGKVIVRGHPTNPPRYYDKLYKQWDQLQLEHIQYGRYIEALAHHEHRTPERLAVQEQVQEARTRSLQRKLT